ncbi:lysoplasmalogenase family protein [Nocardioides caeni]|uniref:Lysoplasmalogenase n=1 Tax=Nocardioides caeni TaxID=574700 RepID=A0A4S8NMX3_9ACTN|nr:lysoplasmalogenase [Nocardioides caeni]THV18317.1 lysoplasmalogenase [Nocardioides caeni]
MTTPARLRLAYVALAAVDTVLAGSARPAAHRWRRITKPMLMPVLAARLATDQEAAGSPLRRSTLAAQGWGWGGDVVLLEEGPRRFAAGAASFGVGHVAYLTGLLARRGRGGPRPRSVATVVAWSLTAPVMARAAARTWRPLGPAVLAYSALLTSVAAATHHLDDSVPADARHLSAAGATLFLLSDSALGTRTFLLRDPSPRWEALVMATYTAGQLLLAEGAARATPRPAT